MNLRWRRPYDEEGSFTFAMLMWILMVFFLTGLVIDGSMEISAREKAADVADQIARNVANDVDQGYLRSTGDVRLMPNGRGDCANDYVDAVLQATLPTNYTSWNTQPVAPGQCTVAGNSVTVTVTITYAPLFWGKDVTTQATANATAITAPTN